MAHVIGVSGPLDIPTGVHTPRAATPTVIDARQAGVDQCLTDIHAASRHDACHDLPANFPSWISLKLISAPVPARRAVKARERVAKSRSSPHAPRNSGVSTPSKRTVVSNSCPSQMVARTTSESPSITLSTVAGTGPGRVSRADSGGIISRRKNRHIAGKMRPPPLRAARATSRHRESNFLAPYTAQTICTYRVKIFPNSRTSSTYGR